MFVLIITFIIEFLYLLINLVYIRSRNNINDFDTTKLSNLGSIKRVREIESKNVKANGMYSLPKDSLNNGFNYYYHNIVFIVVN